LLHIDKLPDANRQVDIRHFFSGRGPRITRIDTDLSGERRLPACWFRQLAETIFSKSNFAFGDFLPGKFFQRDVDA